MKKVIMVGAFVLMTLGYFVEGIFSKELMCIDLLVMFMMLAVFRNKLINFWRS